MRVEHVLPTRMANHGLVSPQWESAAELVAHLGAVQAQDYPGARWALGLRMRGANDRSLEAAFDRGEILRTHVLRPTWHFVAPDDIGWLQQLTGPRVKATTQSYTRRLGLDEPMLAWCESMLTRALEGGGSLTRAEVGAAVQIGDSAVLGQLLMRAELDGLVCSGPPRGREHTYMLLEERLEATRSLAARNPAPAARSRTAEEALAELTWRYFSSHGPALVSDCVWWSSLPAREVKRGLELNRHRLESERIDGREYWFSSSSKEAPAVCEGTPAHLLPNYDEYTVAYRHRELYYDAERNWTGNTRMDVPFTNVILVNGQVAGRWRRVPGRQRLEHTWTMEPGPAEQEAVAAAEERYHRFFK